MGDSENIAEILQIVRGMAARYAPSTEVPAPATPEISVCIVRQPGVPIVDMDRLYPTFFARGYLTWLGEEVELQAIVNGAQPLDARWQLSGISGLGHDIELSKRMEKIPNWQNAWYVRASYETRGAQMDEPIVATFSSAFGVKQVRFYVADQTAPAEEVAKFAAASKAHKDADPEPSPETAAWLDKYHPGWRATIWQERSRDPNRNPADPSFPDIGHPGDGNAAVIHGYEYVGAPPTPTANLHYDAASTKWFWAEGPASGAGMPGSVGGMTPDEYAARLTASIRAQYERRNG